MKAKNDKKSNEMEDIQNSQELCSSINPLLIALDENELEEGESISKPTKNTVQVPGCQFPLPEFDGNYDKHFPFPRR